jgi:hypothetical protein
MYPLGYYRHVLRQVVSSRLPRETGWDTTLDLPHHRTLLLMAAALIVTVIGIAASAAAGAEVGSDECVGQERVQLEEGVWGPRAPLTVQHAQQSGDDPEAFGQGTADEHC